MATEKEKKEFFLIKSGRKSHATIIKSAPTSKDQRYDLMYGSIKVVSNQKWAICAAKKKSMVANEHASERQFKFVKV